MNLCSVSVLLAICLIAGSASGANAFIWTNTNVGSEKPAISLSCLLYGDVGCSKTCQLASLLYDADINPKCVDNVHCLCNEVYHMPNGDLTTGDFQTLSFDTLWENYFENSSQANAIRRYVKKNPEMMALVDGLIRDPHISGEEIKSHLMFAYPDLSSEFKKLISVKRGLKSDLMSGDHLKYEDILDHFNDLVTGIQSSDNELQNIKYRRRIGKILESISDESELGHLVDLVKLSEDESLYNYVTSVLRKRGYVLDSDLEEAIPIVGVFSNGPAEEVLTTNVIREHHLGVDDIGENDMIELSVITNLAKPANENTMSIQITQDDYQQPSVAQIPSVDDVLAISDVLAQMQTDIAHLGEEISQLKSSSSYPRVASSGIVGGNFALSPSQQDLNGMLEMVNANLRNQETGNFEDSVSAMMNALLSSGTVSGDGMPDTAQIEFLNSIPNYMEQVVNVPVSFPDGVTVSKVFTSSVPATGASMPTVAAITPEAIENSVQYTISKRVKMMNDGPNNGPTGVTIYDSADAAATPSTDAASGTQILTSTSEASAPAPSTDSRTQILITNSETETPQNRPTNTEDTAQSPPTADSVQNSAPGVEITISESDGDQIVVAMDGVPNDTVIQTSTPTATKSVGAKKTKVASNTSNTPKTRVAVTDTTVQGKNANNASKTKIAVSETAANNAPQTRVAITDTAVQDNANNASKTRVAVTETAAQANTVKPTKVIRKSSASARTSQVAPAQTAETAGVTQTTAADTAVSIDSDQKEVKLDEVQEVMQSVANVKKRRPQPRVKNVDQQSEASIVSRSVSSSSAPSTVQQTEEDSTVDNLSVTTQTQTSSSSSSSATTTATQEDATANNIYYALVNGNAAENAVPTIQAQEPPATFSSRFGDHVRKFANNFKKS